MKNSTIFPKILKGILAAAFWLAVWYIAAAAVNKGIFLPKPTQVFESFRALIPTAAFWRATLFSVIRIIEGYIFGILIGSFFALFTYYLKGASFLISPAVKAVRATPVVSFILLAYYILNKETIPVAITLLMVVPIIWENLRTGLCSLDPSLSEMAKVFNLSKKDTLLKVTLPQLYPHFYSGALTSLGLAFKSGIAAEVLCSPKFSIGTEMDNAKVALEMPELMVWTLTIVLISLAFEGLFRLCLGRRRVKV